MPRALARALIAASKGLGTRILICSSFFSNSNCTGLNCEKSRVDKSWSRNSSAALSVLSLGTCFFIGGDLPGVHVACGDRAYEPTALRRPKSEGHEHSASDAVPSHCDQAVLTVRVLR